MTTKNTTRIPTRRPTAKQAQARADALARQLERLDARLDDLKARRKELVARLAEVRREAHAGGVKKKAAPRKPAAGGNSIHTIRPYKFHGQWVFDDPAKELDKEAFVSGMDDMIDRITADIPGAGRGFLALFSATPFPGAQVTLEWLREEHGGNVYRWADTGMEGWCCPALLKYFRKPPRRLHIQVKAAR
jgi:hypothetical protein